jgi:hypothetical protein
MKSKKKEATFAPTSSSARRVRREKAAWSGATRRSAGSRSAPLSATLPYDEWKALGAEKAAEVFARHNGWTAKQQGELWAMLEFAWDAEATNATRATPPGSLE